MSRSKPGPRTAYCSFCRKSYTDVGPVVEGPDEVYICGACRELCQDIIDQEKARRSPEDPLAYYRAKVKRLVSLMEDTKWAIAHQVPTLLPATLPAEDVEKIILHLDEIRRLVGGDGGIK